VVFGGGGRPMTSVDWSKCHECDYREKGADRKEKCPNCGAKFLGYWTEKVYGNTSGCGGGDE